MLEQLFLVQLPQQILSFHPEPSRHSPVFEFKLKNLSYSNKNIPVTYNANDDVRPRSFERRHPDLRRKSFF
jgi:hypothetical protein